VDTTDLAILRELTHPQTFQWDVRVSYAEVGRRVGLDEETVRSRVKRMQEDGVITGWRVSVNPRVLGRSGARLDIRAADESAKERVLQALPAMDGVFLVFEYYGPFAGAAVAHASGGALERQAAVLRAMGSEVAVFPLTYPDPTVELTAQDWRIVQALRKDVRRSYAELAEEVGLSERTVRRRVERLTSGKVLYLQATIDQLRIHGLVGAMFVVAHRDPAARGPVDAHLRKLPNLMFQSYEGPVSRVSVGARNVGELEVLRRDLAALPGVAEVRLLIQLRFWPSEGWIDEAIAVRAKG
jgi:Lrp/AsnC family transcriptional regulator, regulator for asnA, asnC and gidA